jgi:PST family polysaccharide transporter
MKTKSFFEIVTSSGDKKVVIKNFISLSILQVANYILPLITLPYLVRVLGPEKFGLIAFAQAFIGYFIVFTNYGFNFSAARDISIFRENRLTVSAIFTSVMAIKLVFLTISFISLFLITISIPKFRGDILIYIYSFGVVIGNALFPVWFFQGIERMKYITLLTVFGKAIFTIAIFIFVRRQEDYLYVPLITSLGFILPGVASLWVVFKSFKVRLLLPKSFIVHQLKEGWHSFFFTVSIAFYTNTNVFVLGLFCTNTVVGYYSAAEKLIIAIQGVLYAASQSIYPYVSKLAADSRERARQFIKKLAELMGISFFTVSSVTFIFASLIVNIVFGPKYIESILVLRIIAFLPFIIAIGNIYAIQGLIAFGHQRVVSSYVGIAAIVYLPVVIVASYLFHQVGTAVCVLVMEATLTLISKRTYFRIIEERYI